MAKRCVLSHQTIDDPPVVQPGLIALAQLLARQAALESHPAAKLAGYRQGGTAERTAPPEETLEP